MNAQNRTCTKGSQAVSCIAAAPQRGGTTSAHQVLVERLSLHDCQSTTVSARIAPHVSSLTRTHLHPVFHKDHLGLVGLMLRPVALRPTMPCKRPFWKLR